MLSGVISRHQNCDDRRYITKRKTHMTEFFVENSYDYNMKHLAIKKTTVGDVISETCQEELRRIVLTKEQIGQFETNTVTEENVYDEVESTKHMPKLKKTKRYWLYGLSTGAVLAGVMGYVFKKLVI